MHLLSLHTKKHKFSSSIDTKFSLSPNTSLSRESSSIFFFSKHLNLLSKEMAETPSPEVYGVVPSSGEVRVQSKLNPFAKEWNPSIERGSEEERSLFFTFSTGHPLRRSQIWRFFSEKYGDCVERIVLRSREQKGTPLFGKVVFKISTVPVLILDGKDEVKFMVNERSLWCKKYQERKSRHENGGKH